MTLLKFSQKKGLTKDQRENKLKNILISIGVISLVIAAFYFFVWTPALESEYKRGLSQCEADTDTTYLLGKTKIIYRDTSFATTQPVSAEETDSSLTLTTSFDTTFVSGKDTIETKAEVNIEVKKENGNWNVKNPIAEWLTKIKHKDFEQQPDTVKIYFPKYIETVVEETNWLITGIAYVSGVISAILIFLLAG